MHAPHTRALGGLLLWGALLNACGDSITTPAETLAANSALLPSEGARAARGKDSPPQLTRRIDRAGRPEIVRTLVTGFYPDVEGKVRAERRYNAAGLGAPEFQAVLQSSLALLDALDNVCGNQFSPSSNGTARYRALASLLLDDQIYVHGERIGGSVYLGLEAEAFGTLAPLGGAAGGRTPNADIIERMYSMLISGELSGVDDGVAADDVSHDPNTFPFLAPPSVE